MCYLSYLSSYVSEHGKRPKNTFKLKQVSSSRTSAAAFRFVRLVIMLQH